MVVVVWRYRQEMITQVCMAMVQGGIPPPLGNRPKLKGAQAKSTKRIGDGQNM
jgi:hypothetical protein